MQQNCLWEKEVFCSSKRIWRDCFFCKSGSTPWCSQCGKLWHIGKAKIHSYLCPSAGYGHTFREGPSFPKENSCLGFSAHWEHWWNVFTVQMFLVSVIMLFAELSLLLYLYVSAVILQSVISLQNDDSFPSAVAFALLI